MYLHKKKIRKKERKREREKKGGSRGSFEVRIFWDLK
jgi:hypothetical protein